MFSRLFSHLQERLDSQAPSGDAVEVTPVSPCDRADALLRQAEEAVPQVTPSSDHTPGRQEAHALARRYLEAGRREWEGGHWGSASLFAELALEWATRAAESGPHDSSRKSAE